MSDQQLRSEVLRIASELPRGNPTRRALLVVLSNHIAAGTDFADFMSIIEQDEKRRKTPRELELAERQVALQELVQGVKHVKANAKDSSCKGLRVFHMEDGSPWPGKTTGKWPPLGTRNTATAQFISPHTYKRVKGGLDGGDVAGAWFTTEWAKEGRWYLEFGVVTEGGRRTLVQKGPWDSCNKMGAALGKHLDKVAAELEAEHKAVNREWENLYQESIAEYERSQAL